MKLILIGVMNTLIASIKYLAIWFYFCAISVAYFLIAFMIARFLEDFFDLDLLSYNKICFMYGVAMFVAFMKTKEMVKEKF